MISEHHFLLISKQFFFCVMKTNEIFVNVIHVTHQTYPIKHNIIIHLDSELLKKISYQIVRLISFYTELIHFNVLKSGLTRFKNQYLLSR